MIRVFIDGSSGTTGLRIHERMQARQDVQVCVLPECDRKSVSARLQAALASDVVFLCLPDDAAREIAALLPSEDGPLVIDTSTAHRTSDNWVYGFPELHGQRDKLMHTRRIANPGCHASGFIALIRPLTDTGQLPTDALLSCFSLTGYSGGGKKMIADYTAVPRDPALDSPRLYAMGQSHKHLPEMQAMTGLAKAPVFSPIVAPFYAGMAVSVPLHRDLLPCTPSQLRACYESYYAGCSLIHVSPDETPAGLSAGSLAERDDMILYVSGNEDRMLVTALFDNLGKGASGAAIQNMNLALGLPETEGLRLGGNL